jgi:hypothetical protein
MEALEKVKFALGVHAEDKNLPCCVDQHHESSFTSKVFEINLSKDATMFYTTKLRRHLIVTAYILD